MNFFAQPASKALAIIIILLICQHSASAQVLNESAKLHASDGTASDNFGFSVSISGDIALVGARLDGDNGSNSGSAYIFRWNGKTWIQEQKLVPSDGAQGDLFGHSVSLSGEVAIVGAYSDDDQGYDFGAAYIFRFNGTTWVEEQKLVASDRLPRLCFGYSVSISGDVAVVGTALDDADDPSKGSAYVFRWNNATWIEEQKLLASEGAAGDLFGYAVAVSGDVAVVGAGLDDDNGADAGSAYVFRWNGSTWIQEQELFASDGTESDVFGLAVSVSGNLALIGASNDGGEAGSAYVFRWNGSSWVQEQKLLATDGAAFQRFGESISISGNIALIGAVGDDDSGWYSGAAYLFRWNGSSWVQERKLVASDAAAGDDFGASVSVSNDVILVGAYGDDDLGSNAGSAYFHTLACGNGLFGISEECDDGNNLNGDGCSATCVDEEGYTCTISQPSVCTDNDECLLETDNCNVNATCANTPGSFVCTCIAGYLGDGVTCRNDNECYLENHNCSADSTCTDTSDGFICTCPIGYSGDGITCVDNDECNLSPTVCDANAVCANTIGNFTCACNDGYTGDGVVACAAQKRLASDGVSRDEFGVSVAVSGIAAVVGAHYDHDNGYHSGAAFVFRRNGATWVQEQKLLASDGTQYDSFGQSVAISGDVVVVGARGDDDSGNWSGSAYVFRWNGSSWQQEQKLLASDGVANDHFGLSVTVSGDVIVVGTVRDNGQGPQLGAAFVFRWNGFSWVEEQKLLASDGGVGDYFGSKVSISGNVAMVGAYGDNGSHPNSGSVYVFRWNGATWIEEQKLIPSIQSTGLFGWSLSVSGDVAILGDNSPPSAYVFRWNGLSWMLEQKLLAPGAATSDAFGLSVSISGDTVLVGAYGDDDKGMNSGSAYLYRWNGSSWMQHQKFLASDGAADDQVGYSVAVSGDVALAGAWRDDDLGVDSGSAYFFDLYCFGASGCSDIDECTLGTDNCPTHATCTNVPSSFTCACNTGYAGAECERCAKDHYNYPTCTFCDAATTCSGNGTCGPQGQCICDSGFTGPHCWPLPPLPAPAPLDRLKNRYVSFVPGNGSNTVAFRVAKTTSPTGSCWVQTPVQSGKDQYTAKCDATPVYRVWDEPVVHVGDCEIIPVANYAIYTNSSGAIENPVFLAVQTTPLPSLNSKLWGDTVGVYNGFQWTEPNQITNVADVLGIVAFTTNASIKPPFVMVNLQAISGGDSCLNAYVNTADMLITVRAIAGDSYGPPSTTKILDPAQCPVCP